MTQPHVATTHALRLQGVGRRFGALHALSDVDLEVAPGERRAILGPNGAGKTTLFNVVAGDLAPTAGRIELFGTDITSLRPSRRTRLGIARTYQTSLLFPGLTVTDNLYLAVRGVRANRFSIRRPRPDDDALALARRTALEVGLGDVLHTLVSALSHGQQRQLEFGMALASQPRVLLLDEPAAGLSPGERTRLAELLTGLSREITVILVEHDMDVALAVADRVTVMNNGKVEVEGDPDEIQADATVQEIYLGRHDD